MSQNYTIAESYELPSKGLIYSQPVKATFKIRSMTTEEEMRRLAPSDTPYKVMADIIEECLVEKPGISVYDMCLGDYQFLLHKLRIVTYGPDYKMMVTCPNCGETYETRISLDSLQEIEYDEKLFEIKKISLPQSKKEVTIKVQTPRILDEVSLRTKEIKRKMKDLNYDPSLVITLQILIDTVDNQKLNPSSLETFVKKLPMRDVNVIIQTADKLNRGVGLDNSVLVKCGSCGYDAVTTFRITPEFFGPTID
jgi:hypothetical protein